MKRYAGRGLEVSSTGASAPMELGVLPLSTQLCSPTQKFPGPCTVGTLWRLHYVGMIHCELSLHLLSPSQGAGWG